MNCLTNKEVSSWLNIVGQIEDPYAGETEPPIRVQFYAPQRYLEVEAFVRCFLDQIVQNGDVLIHITDWEPLEDGRDFVIESIWRFTGDVRSFKEAPACRISKTDWERAVAIFSLTACFGWKSYLYTSVDQTTLYNWEGEIFDVWTSVETRKEDLAQITRTFKLQDVEGEE